VTFKIVHLLRAFSNVFSFSCAAVDEISTDIVHASRSPSAIAELLVLFYMVGILWFRLSKASKTFAAELRQTV